MDYAPVLRLVEKRMAKTLKRPVVTDLLFIKNNTVGAAPLIEGDADFQRLGALSYIRAREAALQVEPVVQEQSEKEAVIFTRTDTGIKSLSEVAGHRVAFAHTNSIVSFMAMLHLARAGLCCTNLKYEHLDMPPLPENLDKVSVGGTDADADPEVFAHKAVIDRVVAREFDVGESRRHHYQRNRHRGLVEIYNYTVPPSVYAARPGLNPGIINAFRQSMLSLQSSSEKGLLRRLSTSTIRGFEASRDSNFDGLRTAMTNEIARFQGR